jgi:cytochrome P450
MVPYLLKAVSPAGPIINKLTFLQKLPQALSPFKREENKQFERVKVAFYEALQDVKDRVAAGTAKDSWSKLWLDGEKKEKANVTLNWHEAAHAIGSSSFVAIATIGGPLHCFSTAMCHYPSWQIKVQEEIDRICGDRLPQLEDMPQLPLLRATVKEILRWRQPTPLGVPHVTLEDDVYDGYFVPKDAIVHANH